jgi:RNA polymerase sigma-70 factor (ECF subfamily)
MQNKTPANPTHSHSRNQKQSLTKLEEEQLLQQLAQGDMDAFWPLWQNHRDYLCYRCIGWMGGDPFEGEDALSLAMIKAREKLPENAEKIVNLRPWLIRFTHNFCVDIHRQRRRQTVSVDYIDEMAAQPYDSVVFGFDSPESRILDNELELFIRQAIDALPDRLRTPFILHYCHQVPYSDIADKMGISTDNAAKRNQQTRHKLNRQLNKYLSGNLRWAMPTLSQEEMLLNVGWALPTLPQETMPSNVGLAMPTLSQEENNHTPVDRWQFDVPTLKKTRNKSAIIDYNLTASCLEKMFLGWSPSSSQVA